MKVYVLSKATLVTYSIFMNLEGFAWGFIIAYLIFKGNQP